VNSTGLGRGPVAATCEYGNEPSGSTQSGQFLDKMSNY
jgi:hypothetical protein